MRFVALSFLLVLALSACSSQKSAGRSHPTATPNSRVQTGPVPGTTPKHGRKLPTVNPHVTPAALPTVKPFHPKTPTPFPASAYKATVYGHVRDAKSHKPLGGVKILVAEGQRSTKTDASGNYRIVFPVRAAVSLQAKKPHYTCGLAVGILRKGQTVKKNWSCTRVVPGHPVPPPFPSTFGQQP